MGLSPTSHSRARKDTASSDATPTSSTMRHRGKMTQSEFARDMEQLLAIVSHELRTPLTAINGNIQLALRRLSAPSPDAESEQTLESVVELLGRAKRQLNRLNNLIEQMLHAERIHEGKLDLRLTHCDLGALVREEAEQQRLQWPDRTITLDPPEVERGDTPIHVVADVDHIAQVIANYLDNALKFSSDDAPVALVVERRDAQARIAVRDQGPGLPTDEHDRVWERFYRVPGVRELSGSSIGFGLGLYICRQIAEQHGGQVGVESTPGGGSTFWFTLDIAPSST